MAATVLEKYTWTPTIYKSTSLESGVNIYVFNVSETNVVDEDTDANGTITEQEIEANSHSVSSSTTTTTTRNPHVIRLLKYGLEIQSITSDITQATTPTYYVVDNDYITQSTKATVSAYTGISVNHTSDSVTLSSNHTTAELYDYLQVESVDTPQYDYPEIMATSDGNGFQMEYDLTISTGVTYTGQSKSITMASGTDVTFSGTGIATNLTIDGDLNYGTASAMSGVSVTGTLDFGTAGTYTFTDVDIDEVTNSSGGSVTINLLGNSSITTNTGPNITVNNSVNVEVSGVVQNTQCYIVDSTPTTILNTTATTNVSGNQYKATGTHNYTSDLAVTVRARDMGYLPFETSGTITSSGLSITAVWQKDPNWKLVVSGVNITFTNATSLITRASGNFGTDGWLATMGQVKVEGSANNNGTYTISAVGTTTVTVSESLTDEGPASGITLTFTRIAPDW